MKKGTIMFNVLIIAILGLIVLIILLAAFSGKLNIFSQTTESCYSKGGSCLSSLGKEKCPTDTITTFSKDCKFIPSNEDNKDKIGQCCVGLE